MGSASMTAAEFFVAGTFGDDVVAVVVAGENPVSGEIGAPSMLRYESVGFVVVPKTIPQLKETVTLVGGFLSSFAEKYPQNICDDTEDWR